MCHIPRKKNDKNVVFRKFCVHFVIIFFILLDRVFVFLSLRDFSHSFLFPISPRYFLIFLSFNLSLFLLCFPSLPPSLRFPSSFIFAIHLLSFSILSFSFFVFLHCFFPSRPHSRSRLLSSCLSSFFVFPPSFLPSLSLPLPLL